MKAIVEKITKVNDEPCVPQKISSLFDSLLSIKFTSDFANFPATEEELDTMRNSIQAQHVIARDIRRLRDKFTIAPKLRNYKRSSNFI